MSEKHKHEHCGHCHEHTHADGEHSHCHSGNASPEEAVALLKYMLKHNQHHSEELHDLGHSFDDEISDFIHDAVDKLEESNALLEQAVSLLNNSAE
ncbi:MAG: hypothetical protein GX083_03960 [Clostridiales bacterium]|nr:hypothetical protein [Clostridiales bacterium]